MIFKARLIIFVVMFSAAGLYVHFFSAPAHDKLVAKLQAATTNEVVAALGQPDKRVAAEVFNARAKQMAQEGYQISNADTTARGFVWLYPEGKADRFGVHRYMTIIFDETSHVTGVYSTFWVKDI